MKKFEQAYSLNVNEKTEKKGNLTYLSWAWAWGEFKKIYPEAKYKIKKFGENSLPYIHDEATGYMVFTEVEADGSKYEMWLPVMDYKNEAMKEPTMFDINKTIMRCLTKNLAMFGLGLYIYAGEDLPEKPEEEKNEEAKQIIEEINNINDIEELRNAYSKYKGKGAEVEKAIIERSKQLK
jgi:hypothetical protein